jgi:hypothetical protein
VYIVKAINICGLRKYYNTHIYNPYYRKKQYYYASVT